MSREEIKGELRILRSVLSDVPEGAWEVWSSEGVFRSKARKFTHSVCVEDAARHECVASAIGDSDEEAESIAHFIVTSQKLVLRLLPVLEEMERIAERDNFDGESLKALGRLYISCTSDAPAKAAKRDEVFLKDIVRLGFDAALAGKSIHQNPYLPVDVVLRASWEWGWRDGYRKEVER